jgi:tetratricopeptide (TPR) repeat protein
MMEQPDYDLIAKVYHAFGSNYRNGGKLEMALSCYLEAETIISKSRQPDALEKFSLLNSIAGIYMLLGELKQAEEMLTPLLTKLKEANNPALAPLMVQVQLSFGFLLALTGNHSQAIMQLSNALQLCQNFIPNSTSIVRIRMAII